MRLFNMFDLSRRRASPSTKNRPPFPELHLIAIALCASSICILVACHGDSRESFYNSIADAKRDGAMDRGWIPDFLPESSHAIHELHDISPSTTWCAFEFLPTDAQSLRKDLKSVGKLPPSVSRVPGPGKKWWPSVLTGELSIENVRATGLELFVIVVPETPSTNEVLLFAIDWQKGRGFFYRTRQ
jgi:hypothetical protein